jgi:hypothetical protein
MLRDGGGASAQDGDVAGVMWIFIRGRVTFYRAEVRQGRPGAFNARR